MNLPGEQALIQIQERRKENIIDFLTLKEVAEICRVSAATVKYWMSMRKISYGIWVSIH